MDSQPRGRLIIITMSEQLSFSNQNEILEIARGVDLEYQVHRQQWEREHTEMLRELETKLEAATSPAIERFVSAESQLLIYPDYEYYTTLSVKQPDLESLLAIRSLPYGGASHALYSTNPNLRRAQTSSYWFRQMQGLPVPQMHEPDEITQVLQEIQLKTQRQPMLMQVFPHGLSPEAKRQIELAGGQTTHSEGVLHNADYRLVHSRVEDECRQGLKSPYVFKILMSMVSRGLPVEPGLIVRIDEILKRTTGESVGVVGLDQLLAKLLECADKWLDKDTDTLPLKFSHSASGLGTFMLTKNQIKGLDRLQANGQVGIKMARTEILKILRHEINQVRGLENLTDYEILEVIENPKRGAQIQKPLNGQKGRETSGQWMLLTEFYSQEELDTMPVWTSLVGSTQNLTSGTVHQGNIANMSGLTSYYELAEGTHFDQNLYAFMAAEHIQLSLLYGLYPPHLGGESIDQHELEFNPNILAGISCAYYGRDYRYNQDGDMVAIDLNGRPTGVLPYWCEMMLSKPPHQEENQLASGYDSKFACMGISGLAVEESILEDKFRMQTYYDLVDSQLTSILPRYGYSRQDVILNGIGKMKGGLKITVFMRILGDKNRTEELRWRLALKSVIKILKTTTIPNDSKHPAEP
jgi:hypothetical protein